VVRKEPPPYGRRKGWIPRSLDDYGDGGAFPEIHVAQFPLNMGKKKATVSTKYELLDINTRGSLH
jgi:SNW domain-containing protein 1